MADEKAATASETKEETKALVTPPVTPPVVKAADAAPIAPVVTAPPVDERILLMQRADMLGVTYHDTIDTVSLRERIQAKLADKTPAPTPVLTGAALSADRLQKAFEKGMVLRRIRLTNMNPAKKDLPGEIFTFANKSLGTVRRYIPYNEAMNEGWHVPEVIYQMLKEKTYLQVKTKKGPGGTDVPDTRWVKEFAIEDLPSLTESQLQNLANQQAAAAGMAN